MCDRVKRNTYNFISFFVIQVENFSKYTFYFIWYAVISIDGGLNNLFINYRIGNHLYLIVIKSVYVVGRTTIKRSVILGMHLH